MSPSKPKLHIDLYNFEDPQFENYRYVLTSPRSLESCSRMNIRPTVLLPKPLSKFQEEMIDVDLQDVYRSYLQHEDKRLELLEQCRKERNKIIESENLTMSPNNASLNDTSDLHNAFKQKVAIYDSHSHQQPSSLNLSPNRQSVTFSDRTHTRPKSYQPVSTTSASPTKPSLKQSILMNATELSDKDNKIFNILKRKYSIEKQESTVPSSATKTSVTSGGSQRYQDGRSRGHYSTNGGQSSLPQDVPNQSKMLPRSTSLSSTMNAYPTSLTVTRAITHLEAQSKKEESLLRRSFKIASDRTLKQYQAAEKRARAQQEQYQRQALIEQALSARQKRATRTQSAREIFAERNRYRSGAASDLRQMLRESAGKNDFHEKLHYAEMRNRVLRGG